MFQIIRATFIMIQEIRSVQRAKCMLFPTPLSKLAQFKVIPGQSSCCQSIAVSYSISVDTIIASIIIFAIFDVQFWWPWSKPVQGHSGSKYIKPIKKPLMDLLSPTLCLSSYVKYLMRKSCDLDLGQFKVIKVILPIDSLRVISYSTSIDPIIVPVTIFKNIWRVILIT